MFEREILPGGKDGWVWNDALQAWLYDLLYWKEVLIKEVMQEIRSLKRFFFVSGFVSRERGGI